MITGTLVTTSWNKAEKLARLKVDKKQRAQVTLKRADKDQDKAMAAINNLARTVHAGAINYEPEFLII